VRRAPLLLLAVLVAVAWALPIGPPVGQGPLHTVPANANVQGLDGARERVSGLQGELAAATAAYERTWAQVEAARVELERLEDRATALERRAADTEAKLAGRARAIRPRWRPSSSARRRPWSPSRPSRRGSGRSPAGAAGASTPAR
jgi:hypothetical protein